jgi:pectin methylesterase-like acyl-CoA thioesterase
MMGAADPGQEGVSRMLKAVLIAASMAVAMPCFAQQVRVIKGDIEHVYGPGGQLLDDAGLQERNQRAWEHMQAENQTAIARRQVEIELGYLRLNTAIARMGNYGGWFIGPP